MKKSLIFLLVLVFALSSASFNIAYAAQYQENALDKAYDWATTLGKSENEKNQIIAEHQAERLKKYAEKEAQKNR